MFTIEINGVNDGWIAVARKVHQLGQKVETRNGPALALPGPLFLRVNWPRRRVLFYEERDANPVFHLMEALWMLAGRNDTAFVKQFNSNIASYSDDGTSFNAAYGFRWASHFGYDQLERAAEMLRANPDDRRVVLAMWDGRQDLGSSSKDIPCNTQVMFRVVNGGLDMTTTNRSNDLVWGLMGANFVHLSIMHEWMAAAVGLPLGPAGGPQCGRWYHMSNNLHVYERHFKLIAGVKPWALAHCQPYEHYETVTDATLFRKECNDLVDGKEDFFEDPFFDGTVAPMLSSWQAWKAGDKATAIYDASCIEAWDWREATMAWYQRRTK